MLNRASIQRRLEPAFASGHLSVATLQGYWYPIARSRQLRTEPLATTLLGIPLVVFRSGTGQIAALLDRCPHRNVPLALGKVQHDGSLQCAYHGWRFCADGRCVAIPGLVRPVHEKLGRVPAFAAAESGGLIWVYATQDAAPQSSTPDPLARVSGPGYTCVMREVAVQSTLHAAIENALDVPHTAFLHGGLFRGQRTHRVTAKVTQSADRVVTEYTGEPRPSGLAARLLSLEPGVVRHWDRFILPSTVEVEYRLGDAHFVVTAYLSPVSDSFTKLFAFVNFRTRVPGWLLRPVLERVAMRIFQQDARMLNEQTRNIERFGGERFANSELDMMGPAVWHLLRRAEAGALQETTDNQPTVIEFEA